ncbi:MAG: SHOCT domain-containing protein [Desulfobacteraceae bacterium]|nr:MAG: SHOCT domain-containing protein [Desulfobacteraceae bacterium]
MHLLNALSFEIVAQGPGKAAAERGPGFCPFFGGWSGGWPFMMMGFLFWVLAILAIFHFLRRLIQSAKRDRALEVNGSSALNILKERYDRGEISGEEFQKIRKDL